jgi:hypothetical protein
VVNWFILLAIREFSTFANWNFPRLVAFFVVDSFLLLPSGTSHKLRKREDWTVQRNFLSLLKDHMMTKYIIVIKRYHLHRQLSKEIVKIGQSIQKLQAS